MRLIDADALIAWTDNYCVDEKFTVAHFANMVRDMPTVQPEIIRCKDCKYMIDIGDDLMCDNAKGWVVATTSDFGCVLAERRTE